MVSDSLDTTKRLVTDLGVLGVREPVRKLQERRQGQKPIERRETGCI